MPYLNVVEVESALSVAASAPYTAFTQRIALPNLTWEGRECHAIKIGNGGGSSRPGVYFLGGVHAREWGSADILINFVEQLEQAYQGGTGLSFGPQTFSAAEIKTIVDTLDIIVFPQANPDGRFFSMNTNANWRKNRRTAAPNSAGCVGVDVNRNYDFLWNFPQYFNVAASAIQDSTNPCDFQLYNGPSAFSEPESRNAQSLFDSFPNVRFFIDVHSFGQDILFNWGDDENQTTDPNVNFLNASFDGTRGVAGDAYKEYIPAGDLSSAMALANTFRDGIHAVRGTTYTVKPSFNLYPTAGTSDDYAYSRHIIDPSKEKVISYVLEWGLVFQPPYSEMQNIIQEITCGLLAFCLQVRKSITDCVVITDRSTFGKDEVSALLSVANPAVIESAFYVIVDGFAASELNITAATLSGIPNVAPAVTLAPALSGMSVQATACTASDPSLPNSPQRFTWTYKAVFTNTNDFTGENVPVTMSASLTSTSNITVSGQAVITLTTQPNPYEIDGPTSWLSVDLQVFRVVEGGHLPSTPGISLDGGPINFIHRLLANSGGGYNDPALARAPNHPFDIDLVANEDSSAVEISEKIGALPPFFPGIPIYNFAVARVRYRALSNSAQNVRVFFRSFQASTTSPEFEPTTTYATGGTGATRVPLLGVVNGEVVTIPFFAAPRVNPANAQGLNAQTDPDNVGPVGEAIPPDGSGKEVQVYFGCWLDINQRTPVLPDPNHAATAAGPYPPVQSVQQAVRGKHQCLVAEIHLDPPEPPIATGTTPAVSDKLAQRNLNIVGVASPHQVPHTFDIKPTRASLKPAQAPDELMIDWGKVPAGSEGSVYLPGLSAKTILGMADKLYGRHGLSSSDAHTVTCEARGITYMPIPPGVGSNYAGLLTVDLPPAVTRGQEFRVVTRQITNISAKRPEQPPPAPGVALREAHAANADLIEWRRVLGAFQISIPVGARHALLEQEERLLSVLRWIFKGIPHHNRWHPVFHRYLEQIAGRVSGLGGDPGSIQPSPSGDGGSVQPKHPKGAEDEVCATGKIAGLMFDRFGDFEGFLLDTEDGERKFYSREKDLAELAERAWRERLRITVCAERHEPHRAERIILRQPAARFDR